MKYMEERATTRERSGRTAEERAMTKGRGEVMGGAFERRGRRGGRHTRMENEVRWERGSVRVRKKAHKLLAKRLSHIMVQ
jgi:hypothetical protein